MAIITLSAQKAKPILQGHPWVFPKAIAKQEGTVVTGDLVKVHGPNQSLLGYGVFNEHSLYRIRMLTLCEGAVAFDLESVVLYRLQQALALRRNLGLPNEQTNAYRLFNSEGDGLSGLTIDVFNEIAIVSSSAYWVEAHRELIIACMKKSLPLEQVIWFPQTKALKQDGWQQPVTQSTQATETVIREQGVLFSIQFAQTQKTGLYLDQRENHARIAALATGKRVLDLYCYTGGFALHAAKAGAAQVTAIDSSEAAIAQAKRNAELNQLSNIEFIETDARESLAMASDYDLVILDPPKLAPSQKHLTQASQYYRFLHSQLFKVLQPGALLMTCNCSAAMTQSEFIRLINESARMVRRECRLLGVYGAASDHALLPAFPEGNYLHAILLTVQ
jgi:23S rRNA (cytosine1962-C5)-methyltransferase